MLSDSYRSVVVWAQTAEEVGGRPSIPQFICCDVGVPLVRLAIRTNFRHPQVSRFSKLDIPLISHISVAESRFKSSVSVLIPPFPFTLIKRVTAPFLPVLSRRRCESQLARPFKRSRDAK